MSLSNLRLSDFKKIAKMLTRKESLLRIVATIDRELQRFESHPVGMAGFNGASSATPRRGRPPGSGKNQTAKGRRRGAAGRHGATKEKLIALLKGAGKQGIHVKDIVKKTGFKDANVRVWFYATGKKIKNVKRVAPATYTWIE